MVGGCGSHPHTTGLRDRASTRPRPPAPSGASPGSQAGLRSRSAGAAVAASRKPLPRTEPFGGRAVWGCKSYEIDYEVVVWNRNRQAPAAPGEAEDPPAASTAQAETLDQ